jgi:hypothetical protein
MTFGDGVNLIEPLFIDNQNKQNMFANKKTGSRVVVDSKYWYVNLFLDLKQFLAVITKLFRDFVFIERLIKQANKH